MANFMSQGNQIHAHSVYGMTARLIVAIDFGTTHSGYAMVHIGDSSNIVEAKYMWPDAPVQYLKNLTALQYKCNSNTSTSWGYSARKASMSNIAGPGHQYLDRFKLYLDEEVAPTLPPLPQGLDVLKVIGDFLHEIYEVIRKDLAAKWNVIVSVKSVVWFLTVPAMWSEKAKQDMREAAVIAGLVSEEDKNNSARLNIVLEPEAAALYCCQQSQQNLLVPGQTFIVVDAGGGTIDLTAFEMLHDPDSGAQCLREISHGSGKSCGSTFIDDAFIKFLNTKCGRQNIDELRTSCTADWLKIMKDWEELKRGFTGDSNTCESIQTPTKLRRLMRKNNTSSLHPNLSDEDDDRIELTVTDFFNIFNAIVDATLDLVELQLDRSVTALARQRGFNNVDDCKIDKMFFVGGFSENAYLWTKAKERFESRVQMFRPSDAGGAVVKGAALFGKFPQFIGSRRSRLTYGVKTSGPWTSDNPAGEAAKQWNEDEQMDYADNLFYTVVNVDQQVGIEEVISTVFIPVNTDQEYAALELYTTDIANLKYMLPNMRPAATLLVPLSKDAEPPAQDDSIQLPLRILFVQDVSASMSEDKKIKSSKEGLKLLCEKLSQRDEVGLIKFSSTVETLSSLQPYSNDIETHIDDFKVTPIEFGLFQDTDTNRILIKMSGFTALNDAIVEGIQCLRSRDDSSGQQEYQNILLVSTDGDDDDSKIEFSKLSTILKNPGVRNFRMILAIAGGVDLNAELVKLCQSNECNAYCEIFNVADSSEGIKQAYVKMEQKVQLLKGNHSLQSKDIKLDIRFGATEVSADAFVERSGIKKSVVVRFHSRTTW